MSNLVILTGLRANSDLHIGNYFGALLPIIDMARHKSSDFQVNLFMPDLHSFTTSVDHKSLQAGIMHNLRQFVAAGLPLDNPNVHIYRQSYIPAHSELTWILDCFTGMGEMERMTQFKDKSKNLGSDRISLGLFNYPVLMASDILLYGASYVPVGEDQTQHLEFTRDIAMRLNNRFGDLFVVPKPEKEQKTFFGKDQALKIKDLLDPTKKMSKSDETGKGVIFLTDSPEEVRGKIMSATTDSLNSVDYDKQKQPGVSNLLELLALLSNQNLEIITNKYKGQTKYGPLKEEVASKMADFISSFQASLKSVDQAKLTQKLELSEKLMNQTANDRLLKVQKVVGLR